MTDCAAISIVFESGEAMAKAAVEMVERARTFKNRFKTPTDEGYRDLMFTVALRCERGKSGGDVSGRFARLKSSADRFKSVVDELVSTAGEMPLDCHVCEVQLHLKELMAAKKSGGGHKMYKVWPRPAQCPSHHCVQCPVPTSAPTDQLCH